MGPLHVVSVISNPLRFASRTRLFREFAQRVEQAGAILHIVELAYGHRPFQVTDEGNPNHYRYRTHEELWHKENLIRLAFSRLPPDWEYAAWVDADVQFTRPDWVAETVHQLQHYKIVQMWTHATDLGPNHEHVGHHVGYVYAWMNDPSCLPHYGHGAYHPGYAWACRRDAYDSIGGIYDTAILGSGDTHMAGAFTGRVDKTFHKGMSRDYKHSLWHYQRLCEKHIRRKVGYVNTSLVHFWHGRKKDRGYTDRWKILSENGYSPYTDIIRNSEGLITLTSEKTGLRDGMMRYFRARQEDSIDI